MLRLARGFIVVACVGVLSTTAYAQSSSITGVVKDTSGAVLPGVTVEAASPVLIEKVRSAVTDGTGQYRIIDLRPGTYTVTFTLTGFATVKREGLVLPADFVSTRERRSEGRRARGNGHRDRREPDRGRPDHAGSSGRWINELDQEHSHRARVRGRHAADALDDRLGRRQPQRPADPGMIVFGGRGGRGNEGQSPDWTGSAPGAAINGGGVSGYGQLENAQEVVMTTAGGLGEAEVGGPIVNMIPKTGGNTFQNHFYGSGMSGWMQSSNYTQIAERFQQRRRDAPRKRRTICGTSACRSADRSRRIGCGFSTRRRTREAGNDAPGHVLQQERRRHRPSGSTSRTSAVRPERQFSGHAQADAAPDGAGLAPQQVEHVLGPGTFRFSDRPQIGGITGPTAGAPETGTVGAGGTGSSRRLEQIRWTSTTTNRLLLEAGLGTYQQNWNGRERPGNNRDLIPVTEQCTAGCPEQRQHPGPGLSRAELEYGLHGAEPVEHVGDVHHRRA